MAAAPRPARTARGSRRVVPARRVGNRRAEQLRKFCAAAFLARRRFGSSDQNFLLAPAVAANEVEERHRGQGAGVRGQNGGILFGGSRAANRRSIRLPLRFAPPSCRSPRRPRAVAIATVPRGAAGFRWPRPTAARRPAGRACSTPPEPWASEPLSSPAQRPAVPACPVGA